MKFTTVKDVPIVSTGTYPLDSGETTFTVDDLKGAVLASTDPTVTSPRIGIGHVDPRFNTGDLDGEPALGVGRNLRLSEDQQTILADYENVPEWLAEGLPTFYPGRSIEGGFGYTAPSGRTYPLVISAIKLLGTELPGVTSLDDLKDLMTTNGPLTPEPVAAGGSFVFMGGKGTVERFVQAKVGEKRPAIELKLDGHTISQAVRGEVRGKVDLGELPRRFATDLDAGRVSVDGDRSKVWARSVQADDDGALELVLDADGKLIRLPFEVKGDAVEYGTPSAVEPIAASSAEFKGPRVLASWPSKVQPSAPEAKTMKIGGTEVDQAVVAKSLGLADDADEQAILAKLGITASLDAEDEPLVKRLMAKGKTRAEAEKIIEGSSEERKETMASGTLPSGVVAIDSTRLAELEEGSKAGLTIAAKLAKDEGEKIIDKDGIEGGRISAGSRGDWLKRWAVNPEEVRKLLTAKAEDGGLAAVIPVEAREVGRSGDGEGDPAGIETEHDAFMRQHFPQVRARLRDESHDGRDVRVRTGD